MPWTRDSEKQKAKWVSVKHCAEHFDCSKAQIYKLIELPRYRDAKKITDVGIRVELNLMEKLILGG